MNRRGFLKSGAGLCLGALASRCLGGWDESDGDVPEYRTSDQGCQATYRAALKVLAGNVRVLPQYPRPVLIEGAEYAGIWNECGPMEALVYRKFRPDVARNGHLAFFALQRGDGQIPAAIKVSGTGWGQIQMVVPIAATAWELARATRDEELLRSAYRACSAWDGWLMRYRNRRGTGLIEGFCTYDTGNDNSPRWAGIPNRCPNADARGCPPLPSLPRLCPDLSATAVGARRALAAMARALGKTAEADRWEERGESLRRLIVDRLYSPEDAAFYDLDAQGHFVRIRSEIITRVCGEHVPDQALFNELWRRQIHAPSAFWPPYPLPSVAVDDPHFVRPIPRNSWGGASQALTALRAGRWLDHYGRSAEFGQLMSRWLEAIQRDGTFRQQVDPRTGVFSPGNSPGYSPCALTYVDYTWRLAGIVEDPDTLQWNIRPDQPAARNARFRMKTDRGHDAALSYDSRGATLAFKGTPLGRIEGGSVRVVTSKSGDLQSLVGLGESPQTLSLRWSGRPDYALTLRPNERWAVTSLPRAEVEPQGR